MSVDYADFGVPGANAAAISQTGVPLLGMPTILDSNIKVINAGASSATLVLDANQTSYEININPNQSGAGATSGLKVDVLWSADGGAVIVAKETWYLWPGAATSDHQVIGRGPSKGSAIVVNFTNLSSVAQYTVDYVITERSHLYTRDDWRSQQYLSTVSGVNLPTIDLPSGLIGTWTGNVAAGANDTRELPLYNGQALLYADTSSAANDMTVTIQDSANPNGEGVGTRFYRAASDASGRLVATVTLPRYQCRLQVANNNAAIKALFWSLHTIEP